MRGWKNIFHANEKQKKAGVAILISDKIKKNKALKIKITRDKEGHYIMIKGLIQKEDMIVNICLVKAMVFPVVMCGCESWTVKKAEC